MVRTTLVLALALALLGVSTASAQDSPAWLVRAEAGASGIHHSGVREPWLGARIGGVFGQSGAVALDAGVAGSEGFTTLTGGLELRLQPRGRLSPFLRVELGRLFEPAYWTRVRSAAACQCAVRSGYFLASVGAGVAVRVSRGVALRAGGSWSHHSTDPAGAGPVCYLGGVEYTW